MVGRFWHGGLAAAVFGGFVVQVVLVAHLAATHHSTAPGVIAGASVWGRYLRTISFFTIQSNLLIGITSAQLALDPSRDGELWRVLRLDALLGITVTGIVYSTVLARIHEPKGWEQVTTNTIFHYAAPVGAVAGWLIFGPRPRVDARALLGALLWPVAWFGYILLSGSIDGWYPYPFVDAATHGYGRVVLNALVVTIVLAAAGSLFQLGDQRLPQSPERLVG